MTAIGKSWCYLFNIWWDDAELYLEELDDSAETDPQTDRKPS